MKKFLAFILTSAILTVSVFASFEADVANSSQIFSERFSAPTWLFVDCAAEAGRKIVLQSDKYDLTFYSKDINYINQLDRYEFPLKIRTKDLYEFNNWVGENTPKIAVDFAEKTLLPGKTFITIKKSSFAPYSSLNVYQRTASYEYVTIAQTVSVNPDNSFTFAVTEGGEYLLSTGTIEGKVKSYGYEVPLLAEVSGSAATPKNNPSTGSKV